MTKLCDAGQRAGLAHGLDGSLTPEAGGLAAFLAWALGAPTLAVIHCESRTRRRRTGSTSACDFFVIVSDYSHAFRSAAPAAGPHGTRGGANGLARALNPKVVPLRGRSDDVARTAKIKVISVPDVQREAPARARNRFCSAALAQSSFGEIRPDGADHETVARSSGVKIHVTECQRRCRFVLGRSNFIRYLRTRPQRRD